MPLDVSPIGIFAPIAVLVVLIAAVVPIREFGLWQFFKKRGEPPRACPPAPRRRRAARRTRA
ncbi:MAG TPA: hypothetical protein PKA93_07955, partial [Arachnia sp.]|nr:hypothetical protein [Arachnia sp.]